MKKYVIYNEKEAIAITSIKALAEDFCNKNGYKYTEEETDKTVPAWERINSGIFKKEANKNT